jgi:hypothetical protein
MDADKDWEARFRASEIRPMPAYVPWLIAEYAPIPGPWWVQILVIGILALFGFGASRPRAEAKGHNPVP